MDQIQANGNTEPIMDENVNPLPIFNSESIPNSQYFNKADERNRCLNINLKKLIRIQLDDLQIWV